MDLEDLLKLKNNLMTSKEYGLLIKYLGDYVTENACKNRNGLEIKGMCELIQQIKNIPQVIERQRRSN